MKRIENDSSVTSIEHWYPLSKDKTRALDYSNMIAVCMGGQKVELHEGEHRELCCDAYKGEREIFIDPQNPEHMNKVKYTRKGLIYTDDPVLDNDIKYTLRLNGIYNSRDEFKCDTSTELLKGRRDAYEKYVSYINVLEKKGKLTASAIEKEILRIETLEKMPEFAGVTLFFLKKI